MRVYCNVPQAKFSARLRAIETYPLLPVKFGPNGRDLLLVECPDFKPGEGRQTSLVGSTPTPFRQT